MELYLEVSIFFSLSSATLISLSFSAQSPFFSLKSSAFAPARIGSVPLVTHLTSSVLHHVMHSFRRSPPSQLCLPTIRTFLQIFPSSLSMVFLTCLIFLSSICHFTWSVWLSNLTIHTGVPLSALNTFMK